MTRRLAGLMAGLAIGLAAPTALAQGAFAQQAAHAALWDTAGRKWALQWNQNGPSLPVTLIADQAPAAPEVAGLDGDWDGALAVGDGMELRLALHVETGPHGTVARLRSIDQQSTLPVSSLGRTGDKVRIELEIIGAVFEATLDAKGQTLTGSWMQSGQDLPLALTRRAAGQAAPGQP